MPPAFHCGECVILRYECLDTGGECGRGIKPMIVVGECMFKMSRKAEPRRGPFRRLSDSEILLFVTQTLHPRTADQETPDFPAKLQVLKDILEQQEIDLLNWPNAPSKDRFYASHLKVKRLIAEIAEDFHDAAATNGTDRACGE
jgi:hypothetical protein